MYRAARARAARNIKCKLFESINYMDKMKLDIFGGKTKNRNWGKHLNNKLGLVCYFTFEMAARRPHFRWNFSICLIKYKIHKKNREI